MSDQLQEVCDEDDVGLLINDLHDSTMKRYKSVFEDIIKKYEKVPEKGRDVVDLKAFTITEDHGHIKKMKPVPVGYYAAKYHRPKSDKKKLKKLVKRFKTKSGPNNFSQSLPLRILKATCENLFNLQLSSDDTQRKNSHKNQLQTIDDLFTYSAHCKKKLCTETALKHSSLTSENNNTKVDVNLGTLTIKKTTSQLVKNVPKNKALNKSKAFDSILDECNQSRNIVSDENNNTQEVFNASKISLSANTSLSLKKKTNTSTKEKQSEKSLISNDCVTPGNDPSDKDNSTHLGFCASKTGSLIKKKKTNATPNKDTKHQSIDDLFKYDRPSSTPKYRQKCMHSVMTQSPLTPDNNDIELEESLISNECMTPGNATSDKESSAQLDFSALKISSLIKRKESNDIPSKDLTPRYTASDKKQCRIEDLFKYSRPTSTPKRRQNFMQSVMKQSPITPVNKNIQLDDLISVGPPTIEKSKLELAKNYSKSETSNKCKTLYLNQKKSADSILSNKNKIEIYFSNSKKIVTGLKYESTVTPLNNRQLLSYVMKSSPQMILKGIEEDDLSCTNIQKKLF